MSSELEAMAAASVGSNLDDEHDPEGSTVAFEREQLAPLLARAEHQLAEIGAALDHTTHVTGGWLICGCSVHSPPLRPDAAGTANRLTDLTGVGARPGA